MQPLAPLPTTYLYCPGELVPRIQAATVTLAGSRLVESGIRTMSLPPKLSAEPAKTPRIQAGS